MTRYGGTRTLNRRIVWEGKCSSASPTMRIARLTALFTCLSINTLYSQPSRPNAGVPASQDRKPIFNDTRISYIHECVSFTFEDLIPELMTFSDITIPTVIRNREPFKRVRKGANTSLFLPTSSLTPVTLYRFSVMGCVGTRTRRSMIRVFWLKVPVNSHIFHRLSTYSHNKF